MTVCPVALAWSVQAASGAMPGDRIAKRPIRSMTDNTNRQDLTGFQRDLLRATLRVDRNQPAVSGQAILAHLEAEQQRDINHGRLYSNLDALVEAGLVAKESIDDRTNDYRPTCEARTLIRRQLQSWLGVLNTQQVLADGGQR